MSNPMNTGYLWGLGMVVSGTFATLIMKTEYSLVSYGREECVVAGTENTTTLHCPFDKPWFGVLQMKMAMSLCLVYLYVRKKICHHKYLETPMMDLKHGGNKVITLKKKMFSQSSSLHQGETESLLNKSPPPIWKTVVALLVPSLLDLFHTVLGNIGLIWVNSSIYQMARGSVIIFSALLSVKVFGKKIHAYHVASIFIVCVAILLVGISGLYQSDHQTSVDMSNEMFGLFLIIMGQFLCAIQIVLEEHMLTKLHVTPVLLVGVEGLWGLVMFLFLGPLLTLTPKGNTAISKIWHEDFIDSFMKLFNSPWLLLSLFFYILAVGSLNVFAVVVTKRFNAVVRSILEACRTLGVWIAGLFLYYVVQLRSQSSPGEEWNAWSWLELLGFVLLLYGTFTYKKLLYLPFKKLYANDDEDVYKSPFMAQVHK